MTRKSNPYFLFFTAFILVTACFCLVPDSGFAWSGRVRVKWVLDGDTLVLGTGERVRLLGIDAPETAHDGVPAQFYASEARKVLWNMVRGKVLTLETGSPERDRFNRILGLLYLPDGSLLNEVLVRRGLAFYFHFPSHPKALRERLIAAQKRAMAENLGFWPGVLGLAAAKEPWVGDKRSGRLVPKGSALAEKINKKNRVWFSSLTEAYAQGYAPARRVTPWPAAGE